MQVFWKGAAMAAVAVCATAAFAQDTTGTTQGAATAAPDSAQAAMGSVHITSETTEFSKFVKLQAPVVKREFGRIDERRWTPSALVSKATGAIDFYVHYYEIYSASTWKFLNHASTDSSESLAVERLSAKVISCVGGCTYREELSFNLTPAIVEKASSQPLRIQLRGREASPYVIDIDPEAMKSLAARAALESAKYRKVAEPALAPTPAAPAKAPVVTGNGAVVSVADELQKLAKLRADGVITDKEFQGLKAKLLAK